MATIDDKIAAAEKRAQEAAKQVKQLKNKRALAVPPRETLQAILALHAHLRTPPLCR